MNVPELADQERVAVGRGLGDGLGADDVRGAALVLDNDLLTPVFAESLRQCTTDDVGDATGHRGDDEGDLPRRIGRRLRMARAAERDQQKRGNEIFFHTRTAIA